MSSSLSCHPMLIIDYITPRIAGKGNDKCATHWQVYAVTSDRVPTNESGNAMLTPVATPTIQTVLKDYQPTLAPPSHRLLSSHSSFHSITPPSINTIFVTNHWFFAEYMCMVYEWRNAQSSAWSFVVFMRLFSYRPIVIPKQAVLVSGQCAQYRFLPCQYHPGNMLTASETPTYM